MLNIVSIVDDSTYRLNDISDVSDKLKKSFDNRNILIINKFYNFHSEKKRRVFLNSFFDCTHFLNNNLTFSNDIANSFQQIISDTLLSFIKTSISFMKNRNVNISKESHIDSAMFNTNTIISVINYLKI